MRFVITAIGGLRQHDAVRLQTLVRRNVIVHVTSAAASRLRVCATNGRAFLLDSHLFFHKLDAVLGDGGVHNICGVELHVRETFRTSRAFVRHDGRAQNVAYTLRNRAGPFR